MDWRRAVSGLRYRLAPTGEVVVGLEPGAAVMAESSRLVYCRGEVDWSRADGGRGAVASWLNRTQRRAAGMEARMSRYEGTGEVGFAPASPGLVVPVELAPDVAAVVCQAESLLAIEAGVRTEVALVRRIREAGSRTTLAMIWLTGEGVAFLCAHGTPVPVTLEAGEAVEAASGGMVRDTPKLMARITGPGRVVLQGQRGGMRGW